jgi:murein DD-endopeptidase MepM/ murein hydrolase activator NlpD
MKPHDCIQINKVSFVLLIAATITSFSLISLCFIKLNSKSSYENRQLNQELGLVLNRLSGLDESLDKISQHSGNLDDITRSSASDLQLETGVEAHSVEDTGFGTISRVPSVEEEVKPLDRVNGLIVNANLLAHRIETLTSSIETRKSIINGIPSLIPAKGRLTSKFGFRSSPFTGKRTMHRGIDIAAPKGTEIMAPADGKVIFAGWGKDFGRAVIISHGFGIITKYGHTSKMLVKKGQKVTRGQVIAKVGTTGRSTGDHLHYEVWVNGKAVNPNRFLLEEHPNHRLAASSVVEDAIVETDLDGMGGDFEVQPTTHSHVEEHSHNITVMSAAPSWENPVNYAIISLYCLLSMFVIYLVRTRSVLFA